MCHPSCVWFCVHPVAIAVLGGLCVARAAEEARLAMEVKLFSRFRSLREAYRMIEQDEKGVIHRRCARTRTHVGNCMPVYVPSGCAPACWTRVSTSG